MVCIAEASGGVRSELQEIAAVGAQGVWGEASALARSAKVVQVPGAGVPAGCPAMTGSMPPSRELPDNQEPNPGPLGGRGLAHTVPLSHILPDNVSYHASLPDMGPQASCFSPLIVPPGGS
jgi:hypothetical protein